MTDDEKLFQNTLQDLRERGSSMDPYTILKASGLLRSLLLDEHPLFDQVNRNYRVKIKFDIGDPLIPDDLHPNTVMFSVGQVIDPEINYPGVGRKTVTRDRFLCAEVMFFRDKRFTVRDVIALEANAMGGVHAGSPKDKKLKFLKEASMVFEFLDLRSTLVLLKGIIRVVVRAIEPLSQEIDKRTAAK